MVVGATRPVLRIFSFEIAKAFYIDWLAFHLDWDIVLRMVALDHGSQLRTYNAHLSEHYGDGSPDVKLLVDVDDVTALLMELQGRSNVYMRPAVEGTHWSTNIFTVLDPFGNRIVFSETITSDGKAG